MQVYKDVITLSEFSLHPLMHTNVSSEIPHNMIYGDLKCERFLPYPLKNALTIHKKIWNTHSLNLSNIKHGRTFIKNNFLVTASGGFAGFLAKCLSLRRTIYLRFCLR